MDTVIILALIIFLIWREWLSFHERENLVDRLMARNLPEYKDNVAPEPNHVDPAPSTVFDLDEAKEEIINGPEEE